MNHKLYVCSSDRLIIDYHGEKITVTIYPAAKIFCAVDVGIDAPRNISVHRAEIYEQIFGNNPFKEDN